VAYVRALSFAFPQKSVMQDIAQGWRQSALQANGPLSAKQDVSSWEVTPPIASSLQVDEDQQQQQQQKRQELVELMRRTAQYDDDDEDEDSDDDYDEVLPMPAEMTVSPYNRKDVVVSPFSASTDVEVPAITASISSMRHFTRENVDKILDEVRPYLISDGGNVSVQRVDEQTRNVYLILEGACGSCSSSTVTMRMGIERVLKENFPNLGQVIQVDSPEIEASKPKELTIDAVRAELNRIGPAITAMGAVVEIVSVDPIGVVELRFRGSNKVQQVRKCSFIINSIAYFSSDASPSDYLTQIDRNFFR